ncbi:MAG: PDZ domain-containing protein [Lachnospiraceae bacterium]|nr:PDZ domain-containing protein [Lachnospiraceae bacterium]
MVFCFFEEKKMDRDFIKEDIKKRPVNTAKVVKKTVTTVVMAIIFGVVASLIILVLTPFLTKITTNSKTDSPTLVSFPEEEMSPEEMLSDVMMQESALADMTSDELVDSSVELPLSEDQVSALLSRIHFDATKYRQMLISMSSYARELGNYMVTITAVKSSVDWLSSVNDSSNVTSGIIVAENNVELLILADSQALKNADSITMSLRTGLTAKAYIKEIDEITGLAIIGVSLKDIPSDLDIDSYIAPLGSSSSIYVGMGVVAVGSPQGVPGSIGYGIVTAAKNMVSDVDTFLYSYQTDILGSSNASGALFNMQGQVVGIITPRVNDTTDNTVVMVYGITELKDLIEKLSNSQKIGYLGIYGTNVTGEANQQLGVPMGAYVTKTEMDSPAMLAGIQVGDVIVGIDEQSVNSFSEYVTILNKHKPDEEIMLKVSRKSQSEYVEINIPLTISSRNSEE